MSEVVKSVSALVCNACLVTRCRKRGCTVSMKGVPVAHVAIDLDCDALGLGQDGKLCDYLFVGEDKDTAWVAPIELKSGAFSGRQAAVQLQGGADVADTLVPTLSSFRFVPVLAHGKRVDRRTLKALRSSKVKLRSQTRQPLLIRCGEQLMRALARS